MILCRCSNKWIRTLADWRKCRSLIFRIALLGPLVIELEFRYKFGLRVLLLESFTHFIAYEASGRLVDKDESTQRVRIIKPN